MVSAARRDLEKMAAPRILKIGSTLALFSHFSLLLTVDDLALAKKFYYSESGERMRMLSFNISILGNPKPVWESVQTLHECNIIDVPDIPVRAYSNGINNEIHMIEGSTSFHRMIGKSIFDVKRNCSVTWNMTGSYNPSMFSGNEFLDSTVAFDNGTVISLVHTEYPGNRYNNCNGPSYPYCWTVSIGQVISDDWGNTWKHIREPPNHLVASVPYIYNESQLAYGWGDPSNILKNPSDGYYYVTMWNRNDVGLQKAGICIARTNNLLDPSSWRGWDGTDYTVTFVSPYTMKPGTESNHICTTIQLVSPLSRRNRNTSNDTTSSSTSSCNAFGLFWSTYLKRYVMTVGCFSNPKKFFITLSVDLVNWDELQLLYSQQKDLPINVKKKVTSMSYPTFLDPSVASGTSSDGHNSNDRNFYTIGQSPYLFWVSIGHSPYTDGRTLWATHMKFQKKEETKTSQTIE